MQNLPTDEILVAKIIKFSHNVINAIRNKKLSKPRPKTKFHTEQVAKKLWSINHKM